MSNNIVFDFPDKKSGGRKAVVASIAGSEQVLSQESNEGPVDVRSFGAEGVAAGPVSDQTTAIASGFVHRNEIPDDLVAKIKINIGQFINRMVGGLSRVGLYVASESEVNRSVANPTAGGPALPERWNVATAYAPGDVIERFGVDYLCVAASTGDDPEANAGIDSGTSQADAFLGSKWQRRLRGFAAWFGGGLVHIRGTISTVANSTSKTAFAGTDVTVTAIPAAPAGYLTVLVDGVPVRIPYYASAAGQPPVDQLGDCCDDPSCCPPVPLFDGMGTLTDSKAGKSTAAAGFNG